MLFAFPVTPAGAQAIRGNAGFNSNVLPANDDGSDGPIALPFSVDYFGLVFTELWVNNNGNVTFDGLLSTYTPFDLTSTGSQIFAPFFADVDTRGAGSGVATYGSDTVDGRAAFGVNWIDVGYFSSGVDKLNSFQLVMIDRSDLNPGDVDVEFNYDTIEWETGEASNGSGGLGGNSARAGFSNGTGDPGTFLELTGSAVNGAFLDSNPTTGLAVNSNIGVPGRYLFEVRNGGVEVCGNGTIEGLEECDDGNTVNGDCCSSSCLLDAPGTPCANNDLCDGDETCDGAGACESGAPLDCDDQSPCTQDSCDAVTGCIHAGVPASCTEGFADGTLIVNEKVAGKEKMILKMLKGPASTQSDFGDPTVTAGTTYDICLYDGSGSIAGALRVDRAGDACGAKPCWKSIGGAPPDGKGFLYKDKSTSSDGVKLIKVKAGSANKTKLIAKGKNNSKAGQLEQPTGITGALAGASSAIAQVHAGGTCYSMDFTDVKKAEPDFFKAK